jgi:1-acyl-sn-glycerol-3-phosphate acyltransferase
MTEYSVPLANRIARAILRPACRLLFYTLSDVTITGKDNIPAQGSYVIAYNHISHVEPPMVLAFWPVTPEALGAIEVWQRPGQDLLARLYHGIPIHRGELDHQPLKLIIAALQSGRILCMAPEGRRAHQPGMNRARPGAAFIVEKTGAQVVPVAIVGTSDQFLPDAFRFKHPKVAMHIGKPIQLPPVQGRGAERRRSLQANADQIMLSIASMMPPEYRGVYLHPEDLSCPEE